MFKTRPTLMAHRMRGRPLPSRRLVRTAGQLSPLPALPAYCPASVTVCTPYSPLLRLASVTLFSMRPPCLTRASDISKRPNSMNPLSPSRMSPLILMLLPLQPDRWIPRAHIVSVFIIPGSGLFLTGVSLGALTGLASRHENTFHHE